MLIKSYLKYSNGIDYLSIIIISKKNDKLFINIESTEKHVKVPIYTTNNNFIFEPIIFPFSFSIKNDTVYSEYNGLYRISNDSPIEINFFNRLSNCIYKTYGLYIGNKLDEPTCELTSSAESILYYLHYNRTNSDNDDGYYNPMIELSNLTSYPEKYYEYFYVNTYKYILEDANYFTIENDINIINLQKYNNDFIINITSKYSSLEDILLILKSLMNFYSYPIKIPKNLIDPIFDQIIYISLYHIDLLNEYNNYSFCNVKLKILYLYIIKLYNDLNNDNIIEQQFNNRYITDYLYRSTTKLLLKNDTLSYMIFKKTKNLDKFIEMIKIKTAVYDIMALMSWENLQNINIISFFFSNKHLIDNRYYTIISNDKIKNILENPYIMYNYLSNMKDFIKWTKIISNDNTTDVTLLGKIIYYLYNSKKKDITDINYNIAITMIKNNKVTSNIINALMH